MSPVRTALLISNETGWAAELARHWAHTGDVVTVVLCDGAAAAARVGHRHSSSVAEALASGIEVLVEERALARRGNPAELVEGVKMTDLDQIADLLLDGVDKAVWW